MARRARVDLEATQYAQVLDALPMSAHKAGSDFIPYPSMNFKHSPKWQHCSKYRPAVAKLFEFSGGRNANQNSFFAAAKQYNLDHSLGLTPDALEKGIYRLRTIVSQLINHKVKERTVPRQWQRAWQVLYEGIRADTTPDDQDDANADIVYLGPVILPEAVVVDLTSELLEDDWYEKNVLQSDDPVLQRLLSGEEPGESDVGADNRTRRRRRRKQPEQALSKSIGGMDTATLQSLISDPVNQIAPKAWAALNSSLKKDKKKGGAKKREGARPKRQRQRKRVRRKPNKHVRATSRVVVTLWRRSLSLCIASASTPMLGMLNTKLL